MTQQPAAQDPQDRPRHSNLNIGAETVKAGLERKIAAKEISSDQAELVWWFYCFCREQNHDLVEAAQQIGKDSTTVYRLFNCTYGAKIDNLCADIARYKKLALERAGHIKLDFVETSIAKTIWRACDGALVTQTIAMIYGDSQIGKTFALMEYARRNNHGQTKYMRMPASAGVQLFMRELARACYLSPNRSFDGMRESVLNTVDDKTLIIVDEIHQGFLSYQKGSQLKVLEVLREIYDRTQCGMVLCGTNVWRREMMEGKLCQVLEQLRRRGTIKIQLPARPPKSDLDRIARRFNLTPPDGPAYEVVKEMLHTSGLGMYVKYLQNGARMAQRAGEKFAWDHFVQAHDIIAKLSAGI